MKSSKIPSSRINMTSIPSVIAAVVVIALLLTLCAAPALAGGSRVADVNASQPVDNSTWYLAEGSIAWGFDTYITIENPNDVEVNADVTYMPTAAANVHKEYTLPPKSHTSIWGDNIAQDIGAAQDFSTMVHCREGRPIAVDRTMTWTGKDAASPEAHSSIGVTAPKTTWYLPEGSSKWGFECWLLIQNPGSDVAHCHVTYMIEGAEPQTVNHDIPATSRKSFSMKDDIGEQDASIKVESDIPVIPERSMYWNHKGAGTDTIGGYSD